MTSDANAPGSRLDSAGELEPRIRAILEFVLALADGSEPQPFVPSGQADSIEAIGVALNLLAETFAAEKLRRRHAEELLRDERAAYDEAADLLCSVTPAGTLLKLNGTFTEVLAERGELIGRPLEQLFAARSRDDLRRSLAALCAGEPPPAVDLELNARNEPVQVRLQGKATRDAGAVTRLRLALRDVTGERQLEQRLLAAQHLEALGRLAGGVAHDFNNLLMVMRGTVDFVAGELDEGARKELGAFHEAAESATSIVRQMLTFARRDVVTPTSVEVKTALDRALPILTRLAGDRVSLHASVVRPSLHVPLDEGRLHQLLVNLVVNARDAMPDGGKVSLQVGLSADAPPSVQLVVDDSGPGIPRHLRDAIFEPFYTTKPPGKGTGLGLATVHGIVTKAGGTVEVHDSPLGGARFVLQLPAVARGESAPRAAAPAVAPTSVEGALILIIEDDDLVRSVTCRILRSGGYRVIEATNRMTAVERATAEPIELVIADVLLDHDTGPEVVELVRGVRPSVPALYVSGYARDALERPQGAEGLLQKPFKPQELLSLVKERLSKEKTTP
jgi:signal transduction histidine kinase